MKKHTYIGFLAALTITMMPFTSFADTMMNNGDQTIMVQGSDEEVAAQIEELQKQGYSVVETPTEAAETTETEEADPSVMKNTKIYDGTDFNDEALSFMRENISDDRYLIMYFTEVPEHMVIPKDIIKMINDHHACIQLYYGADDVDADSSNADTMNAGTIKGGVFLLGMDVSDEEERKLPEEDIDFMPSVKTENEQTTIHFNSEAALNQLVEIMVPLSDATDGEVFTYTQNGTSYAQEYDTDGLFITLNDLSDVTITKGVSADAEGKEYLSESAQDEVNESLAHETTSADEAVSVQPVYSFSKKMIIGGVVVVAAIAAAGFAFFMKNKKK